MTNSRVDTHFNNDSGTDPAERLPPNRHKLIFDARFRRCYRTLHFIACRVLGGSERAEEAIGSCWRIASRHPQQFEHEGEFHSWLLRILIDEALVLLRERAYARTSTSLMHYDSANSSGACAVEAGRKTRTQMSDNGFANRCISHWDKLG